MATHCEFSRGERNDPKGSVNELVYALLEDKSGQIWIGTVGSGVNDNPSAFLLFLG